MPRIRMVKPEFWTDGVMVQMSPLARLLYIGMWNFAICDAGHLEDDALRIKLQILPAENCDVAALVEELVATSRVERVSVENRSYLHIRKFQDHQKIDSRWTPRCPVCAHEASPELPETHASPDETHRDSPKNTPLKGKSGGKSGGKSARSNAASRATAAPDLFPVTDDMRAKAREKYPLANVDRETERFLDHHRAKGSTFKDWNAAWRTWMGNAQTYAERDGRTAPSTSNPYAHLRSFNE